MARKNEFGKYILSAGEVGAFTVCPEAWRLKMVEKVKGTRASSADEGLKLHAEWAEKYTEAEWLREGAMFVIALIGTATVVFALLY